MLEYVNQGNAQIKVFGVGGGGSNAVDCMIEDGGGGLEGISFICSNTDAQALQRSAAPIKIQLGMNITQGLGAGANPEIGEQSALEDQERIREVLEGADMVFITAGMGGGTGTGAAPIVAQIAKSLDILTVAVVTKPLKIEGRHRMESAERGIQELRRHVDSLIEIPNQRLLGQSEGMNVQQTFAFANKVLIDAVRGITEIINNNGVINVDFADVKTIMSNQGSPSALMGTGIGRGEKRALSAAAAAISSPLLNHDISGASAVLMNFTGGTNMSLDEIHDAADTITQKIAGDPQVILGMVVDESGAFDEECMKVTVIATGFPEIPAEDYFDAQPVKTASPYGHHRPGRSSLPARQRPVQSAPPSNTYKTPSVSTNPPIVNDASSSSSSDEHPQWRAEAPSIINEVPSTPVDQNAIKGSFSAQTPAYGQRSAQPSYSTRAEPSAQRASQHDPSGPRYPEQNAYPQSSRYGRSRAYESTNNAQAPSYGRGGSRVAPYSSRQGYSAQAPSQQANEVVREPTQAREPRPPHAQAERSRPSSPRRDRGRASLSSLMPVAPIDSAEDSWGQSSPSESQRGQSREDRPVPNSRQTGPEASNTQDYDSVGYSPNGLPVYRS